MQAERSTTVALGPVVIINVTSRTSITSIIDVRPSGSLTKASACTIETGSSDDSVRAMLEMRDAGSCHCEFLSRLWRTSDRHEALS